MKYKIFEHRTKTIYNDLNPKWNLTAELKMANNTNDMFEMTVFDEDIGYSVTTVPTILEEGMVSIETSVKNHQK